MLHFLLPDLFVSSEGFDKAVDHANQAVDTERLMHARRLLSCFMLRRTKEVVGLPQKTEVVVTCPMVTLQAQWYKRLLASDKSSHAVLSTSQLKTLRRYELLALHVHIRFEKTCPKEHLSNMRFPKVY